MATPPGPASTRPWTAGFLGLASLANLALLYLVLRDVAAPPTLPVLGIGLLTMLQAFAGAQALEGRRYWITGAALAGTLLQLGLLPLVLPAAPVHLGTGVAALLLATAGTVALRVGKRRSITH